MAPTGPERWSIADTVRRVGAGEITAAKLVDTMLGRIADLDRGHLHRRAMRVHHVLGS